MSAAANKPATASFKTTLSAMGNNTGIEVPEAVVEALNSGKRPPVIVNVNGYEYQNTVGVMAGKYLISVSAAVRAATGIKGGDAIDVTLTVTDKPRAVEVPADFREALDAHGAARTFFGGLSNSLQRYHIDNINGAKTAETRQRRIDKSISLFLEGKQPVVAIDAVRDSVDLTPSPMVTHPEHGPWSPFCTPAVARGRIRIVSSGVLPLDRSGNSLR